MSARAGAHAVAILRECAAALRERGGSVIGEALGSNLEPEDWRHYPAGEVYDPLTHIQYFYHRHPRTERASAATAAEHGHFHLFLRGEGMPAGIAPMVMPEIAVANAPSRSHSAPSRRGASEHVCHIVGISVDCLGTPIRLFTTNRWVTGESWYRADDVIRMLDCWRPGTDATLSRWLAALVRLFQPEIAVLHRNREKAVADWRWRWPRSNALEDARLEMTSFFDIDFDARMIAEEQAGHWSRLEKPSLPPMAEGWGS